MTRYLDGFLSLFLLSVLLSYGNAFFGNFIARRPMKQVCYKMTATEVPVAEAASASREDLRNVAVIAHVDHVISLIFHCFMCLIISLVRGKLLSWTPC